jgi:hypothetical protein
MAEAILYLGGYLCAGLAVVFILFTVIALCWLGILRLMFEIAWVFNGKILVAEFSSELKRTREPTPDELSEIRNAIETVTTKGLSDMTLPARSDRYWSTEEIAKSNLSVDHLAVGKRGTVGVDELRPVRLGLTHFGIRLPEDLLRAIQGLNNEYEYSVEVQKGYTADDHDDPTLIKQVWVPVTVVWERVREDTRELRREAARLLELKPFEKRATKLIARRVRGC